MSIPEIPPPPHGSMWHIWAERLNAYLVRVRDKLDFIDSTAKATQDGVLLWDAAESCPVVSSSGEWMPLAYGHGDHAAFYTIATHSAAAINTAYAITWENTAASKHISIDGTYTSRVVFEHDGTYQIDFSCELSSTNASAKTIYIFPRVNGTDIPYSTIVHTVTGTAQKVVSRSGIFTMSAGDYLEAVFAVTDTNLQINGSAATAFSPAAPSATLVVSEVTA